MKLTLDIPEDVTFGDLLSVRGSLVDAAAIYVDWDALTKRSSDAIARPGVVLLVLAGAIHRAENSGGFSRGDS